MFHVSFASRNFVPFCVEFKGLCQSGMFCHRAILVSCFLSHLVFDVLFAVKTCYREQTVSLELLIANELAFEASFVWIFIWLSYLVISKSCMILGKHA